MNPISPENRPRYPADWPVISKRIRFERAKGQCECPGDCGREPHALVEGRCPALHGQPIVGNLNESLVVLTTAHLDHNPENCVDANLRAMCQACHLTYDREHHAETRRGNMVEILGNNTLDGLDL